MILYFLFFSKPILFVLLFDDLVRKYLDFVFLISLLVLDKIVDILKSIPMLEDFIIGKLLERTRQKSVSNLPLKIEFVNGSYTLIYVFNDFFKL